MIKVDSDILCDYCHDNEIANRNNCEGSRCDEARIKYLDDHGIEGPECFFDLQAGQTVYYIDARKIIKASVKSITTDKDSIWIALSDSTVEIKMPLDTKIHDRLCLTKANAIETFQIMMNDLHVEYQNNLIDFITKSE